MSRELVRWTCAASPHLAEPSRRGRGGLTIHEGAWAYCDGATADDAHQWVDAGGVSLEALIRWDHPSRPVDSDVGVPVSENGAPRVPRASAPPAATGASGRPVDERPRRTKRS